MCCNLHINGKFYLKDPAVTSQPQILCSGTVDAFTVLLKMGAVTGTVPGRKGANMVSKNGCRTC